MPKPVPINSNREQRTHEVLLESMRREGLTPESDRAPDGEIELTPRERAVARAAAMMAVEELADKFYKQIGKTFATRVLVWVGMTVAGFVLGKFGITHFWE